MDLWIRSQDKELLIKSSELRYNQKGNDHSILTYDTVIYRILGKYKTKERALEVLDDIQRFYEGNVNRIGTNEYIYCVYNMPKE